MLPKDVLVFKGIFFTPKGESPMGNQLKEIKSIFVVKNRALGDSVMSFPTLDYIKEILPSAEIYYGMPSWVVPLYSNVDLNRVNLLPLDLKGFTGYWQLFKFLRKSKIDFVYEMHLSGRTKNFFSLYSKIFRVPYYYHNHHLKKGESRVIDQGVTKPLIQRDLDGAYSYFASYNVDVKRPFYTNYPLKLRISTPQDKDSSLLFGVVATRETKRYPLSYFKNLAILIGEKFPNVKIKMPLSLSEDDIRIKKEIEALNFPLNCEIVFWELKDLPLKMSKSSLYIGNDTGLKHLSIALGLKTYTFFGPEPPLEWHPYDRNQHPYFFIDGLECRTKTHHYCGLSTCETMICLKQLSPKQVFNSIDFSIIFN